MSLFGESGLELRGSPLPFVGVGSPFCPSPHHATVPLPQSGSQLTFRRPVELSPALLPDSLTRSPAAIFEHVLPAGTALGTWKVTQPGPCTGLPLLTWHFRVCGPWAQLSQELLRSQGLWRCPLLLCGPYTDRDCGLQGAARTSFTHLPVVPIMPWGATGCVFEAEGPHG